MQLLILQFSLSCHFLPLRPKYESSSALCSQTPSARLLPALYHRNLYPTDHCFKHVH